MQEHHDGIEINGRTVAENINQIRKIAIEVWQQGHVALAPHLNTEHFEAEAPNISDETWLAVTAEMLRRCDAILMSPNWKESEGAVAERE